LITKKRRGPKPSGVGRLIGVRLLPEILAALDSWIAAQPNPKPSRPEALRRLAVAALTNEGRLKRE